MFMDCHNLEESWCNPECLWMAMIYTNHGVTECSWMVMFYSNHVVTECSWMAMIYSNHGVTECSWMAMFYSNHGKYMTSHEKLCLFVKDGKHLQNKTKLFQFLHVVYFSHRVPYLINIMK